MGMRAIGGVRGKNGNKGGNKTDHAPVYKEMKDANNFFSNGGSSM